MRWVRGTRNVTTCAVELREHHVARDSSTKLPKVVDDEESAITITPAIAVVSAMTVIDNSIILMNGWRAQEELAAILLKLLDVPKSKADKLTVNEPLGRFVLLKGVNVENRKKPQKRTRTTVEM